MKEKQSNRVHENTDILKKRTKNQYFDFFIILKIKKAQMKAKDILIFVSKLKSCRLIK